METKTDTSSLPLPKAWPGAAPHLPACLGGRDAQFEVHEAPESNEVEPTPPAASAAETKKTIQDASPYPPPIPLPPSPAILRPPRAPRRAAPKLGAAPAPVPAPQPDDAPPAPNRAPPAKPAPSRVAPARPLAGDSAPTASEIKAREELLETFSTVMLDCDGVIWLGDQLIEGAKEALARLRTKGKRLVFVSNNSSKDRQEYVKKFQKLGIEAEEEDVVSSSYAVAAYLDALSKTGQLDSSRKVFVLGSNGIRSELEKVGFSCIMCDDVVGDKHFTADELATFQVPEDIGAVVVGQDQRMTYSKCAYTAQLLHRDPSTLFVCTNQDQTYPVAGRYLPGTGCTVRMVMTAAMRSPVDVGKPSPWMFELVRYRHKLDPSEILFVGDRMSTDIRMGNAGKASTLLVLTGVNTAEDVLSTTDAASMPTYVAGSLADIC